jgi:transcriptional regulator with GAF, ATPase, and Fis domain
VSEIPLALQPKLLRVLQEGTFERVGEDRGRKVNVRVLAATNRDLRREADAGGFRSDLYFRLSVFPIFVPPLRDRREDIPTLAQNFADASCRKLKRRPLKLTLGHLFFDVLDVGDVSAGSWFLIPYCAQNRNWNASSRRIQN